MSVDRTACIGHGWVISHERYEQMRDAAETAGKWGEIEEYFRYINAYHDDSDVFFGDIFYSIGEADYVNIADLLTSMAVLIDEDKFSDAMCDILETCGERVTDDSIWHEAQIYMLTLLH